MTPPASGGIISLADVLAEIRTVNPGRSGIISLGDADVLALAGKSAPPISLSDLYGKSSYIPMSVTPHDGYTQVTTTFSGGTASVSGSVSVTNGTPAYSYAWSFINQNGFAFSGPTNSSVCSVTHSFGKLSDGFLSADLQCIVTDSTGRTATVQVNVVIECNS